MPETTPLPAPPIEQAVILVGGFAPGSARVLDAVAATVLPTILAWVQRHAIGRILLLADTADDPALAALDVTPGLTLRCDPDARGVCDALRRAAAAGALDARFFLVEGAGALDINLWDLAQVDPAADAVLALRAAGEAADAAVALAPDGRITTFGRVAASLQPGGIACLARRCLARSTAGAGALDDLYGRLAAEGGLRGRLYHGPFVDRSTVHVPSRRGAVIFDRDGVLNREVDYAHRPDHIIWTDTAMAAVKAVNDAGLFAFVATNQAGVAHGLYGEAEIAVLHHWMNEALKARGAHIDAFVYCPDHPEAAVAAYRRQSPNRKPAPGMILELLRRFPVDPARTIMIGDRPTDVEAATAAGIPGLLFDGTDLLALVAAQLPRLAPSAAAALTTIDDRANSGPKSA